jgi:hypothetical protein
VTTPKPAATTPFKNPLMPKYSLMRYSSPTVKERLEELQKELLTVPSHGKRND